jgi:hypothetical protein
MMQEATFETRNERVCYRSERASRSALAVAARCSMVAALIGRAVSVATLHYHGLIHRNKPARANNRESSLVILNSRELSFEQGQEAPRVQQHSAEHNPNGRFEGVHGNG